MIISFSEEQLIKLLKRYYQDYDIKTYAFILENHYEQEFDVLFEFIHKDTKKVERVDMANLVLLFNNLLENNHILVENINYDIQIVNKVPVIKHIMIVVKDKVSMKKVFQKDKNRL